MDYDPNVPVTVYHDGVLLYVPPVEQKTAGGIILPDEHKDRQSQAKEEGIVLALGETAFPGLDNKPEPGMKVLINRYAGRIFSIAGVEYRVVPWEEIKLGYGA